MMHLFISLVVVIAAGLAADVPNSTLNLVSTSLWNPTYSVSDATDQSTTFQERDCCREVVIKIRGNDTAYRHHHQLFTTYQITQDKKAYMSTDGRHIIGRCDGLWMLQKTENRYGASIKSVRKIFGFLNSSCPQNHSTSLTDLSWSWTYLMEAP